MALYITNIFWLFDKLLVLSSNLWIKASAECINVDVPMFNLTVMKNSSWCDPFNISNVTSSVF